MPTTACSRTLNDGVHHVKDEHWLGCACRLCWAAPDCHVALKPGSWTMQRQHHWQARALAAMLCQELHRQSAAQRRHALGAVRRAGEAATPLTQPSDEIVDAHINVSQPHEPSLHSQRALSRGRPPLASHLAMRRSTACWALLQRQAPNDRCICTACIVPCAVGSPGAAKKNRSRFDQRSRLCCWCQPIKLLFVLCEQSVIDGANAPFTLIEPPEPAGTGTSPCNCHAALGWVCRPISAPHWLVVGPTYSFASTETPRQPLALGSTSVGHTDQGRSATAAELLQS